MFDEELIKLACPICREVTDGSEPMLGHLMEEHEVSKRQAKFLVKKMIDWKQETLDPTLFPPEDGRYYKEKRFLNQYE